MQTLSAHLFRAWAPLASSLQSALNEQGSLVMKRIVLLLCGAFVVSNWALGEDADIDHLIRELKQFDSQSAQRHEAMMQRLNRAESPAPGNRPTAKKDPFQRYWRLIGMEFTDTSSEFKQKALRYFEQPDIVGSTEGNPHFGIAPSDYYAWYSGPSINDEMLSVSASTDGSKSIELKNPTKCLAFLKKHKINTDGILFGKTLEEMEEEFGKPKSVFRSQDWISKDSTEKWTYAPRYLRNHQGQVIGTLTLIVRADGQTQVVDQMMIRFEFFRRR